METTSHTGILPRPAPTVVTLNHPSYGVSPSGFPRLHVELLPAEVGHVIGYDPRSLVVKLRAKPSKSPKDTTPHNVSHLVVQLQNQVQRSIDGARVGAMVQYLRAAMESATFADWGAIEVVTSTLPDTSRMATDHYVTMPADADYFIADGQHRYAAILDFCRDFPEYCDRFTQAVTISILPPDRLVEWASQAFHDRNYYAVAVRAGKALSTDSRDPLNQLTKELADHPAIKAAGGIAYERDTLLKSDARFTTHSVLHRFVRGFLYGRAGLDKSPESREVPAGADEAIGTYIDCLANVLPWISTPSINRDEYLSRASVVLSALAVVGYDLQALNLSPDDLQTRLRALSDLDWRRTNLDWEGVVGAVKDGSTAADGTVVPATIQPASSRPAIDATIRHLRGVLGITPSRPVPPSEI